MYSRAGHEHRSTEEFAALQVIKARVELLQRKRPIHHGTDPLRPGTPMLRLTEPELLTGGGNRHLPLAWLYSA
jgi:hypothetical protein